MADDVTLGQDASAEAKPTGPRRTRRRSESLKVDVEQVARDIVNDWDRDLQDRVEWNDKRLQQWAKLHGILSPKSDPWPDACFLPGTDILTSHGWMPVEVMVAQADAGLNVFSRNPQTGELGYIPVEQYFAYDSSQGAVRLKTQRGIDITVTGGHRVYLIDERDGTYPNRHRFVEAKDLIGKTINHWGIPMAGHYEGGKYPDMPEDVNPLDWYELWGWYLAEGWWDSSNNCSIGIAQESLANAEKYERITSLLNRLPFKYAANPRQFYVNVGQRWRVAFAATGRCRDKSIPRPLLDGPTDCLKRMLDAMMLGDGHVTADGHRTYATVSQRLADDAQELFVKTGTWARVRLAKRKSVLFKGHQIAERYIYEVSEHQGRELNLEHVKKFATAVEYDGPSYCISTSWGVVYARMNGVPLFIGQSNAHVPMMMTDALRVQDSLFNAVMTTTPPISSRALHKGDVGKQDRVDNLLYHQMFIDQRDGEEKIAALAQCFVEDGTMCGYSAWVRDDQVIADTHIFDPLPDGVTVEAYVRPLLGKLFQRHTKMAVKNDGFSWTIHVPNEQGGKDRTITVEVYIHEEGGSVQLVETGKKRVYDGPVLFPKSIEDWASPFRAENLQPPGPANPGGAAHVTLADYPTLDELKRLKAMGFYDLVTDEQLDEMAGHPTVPGHTDQQNDDLKEIKDVREGTVTTSTEGTAHPRLTRLICFMGLDIDGDGLEEQVVCRVIRETHTLLRVTLLNEEFPSDRPHRPLMHRAFIPVKDRIYGLSLPELLEPLYDMVKILLDQMVDGGTIRIMPFGFVKAHGGLRNEPIRIVPGLLQPTASPKDDVNMLQFGNNADALFTNLITIYSQWADQLTMIGELQFGQVPGGKASALRTVGGMLSVLQQGDARPEHILRRFFSGLGEIHATWHDFNQALLPKQKEIRMVGIAKPGEDVYQTISDRSQIAGRFQFDFKATVLNMSKGLMAQSLGQLLSMTLQPLILQMGIAKPDGVYRLMRDLYKANGRDPDEYLSPPSPDASLPRLSAQEALTLVMMNREPVGLPSEAGGIQEHLEALSELPESLMLDATQNMILQRWLDTLRKKMPQEAEMRQMMAAAAQMQNGGGGQGGAQNGGGRPPEAPAELPQPGPAGNAMVSPNEQINESLPTSGGGANQGRF